MYLHSVAVLEKNIVFSFAMRKKMLLILIVAGTILSAGAQTKKSADSSRTLTGTASYYAQKFEGKKTASGEIFHHKKLTAACNKLPMGIKVRVTNLNNNKSVKVLINDRLAAKNKRLIDLTEAAAKKLSMMDHGLINVKVEVISEK
jgi:rare lipoprotein A